MAFCVKCGTENQSDDNFCHICGHPISTGQAARTAPANNDGNRTMVIDQMNNARNLIGVFFVVGLITFIYFLMYGEINPLTSGAVIILGIFIFQSNIFLSTPNKRALSALRNIFYIFVGIACSGLVYGGLMWGFQLFLILELIYFLIVFYLMNQYVTNAQMI